jgi:two-component system, OmpR family, sensor histidine kinase CiaH
MFHKLKIRLIMINMCSLSIVLIIIFSGIYLVMKNGNEHQSQMKMDSIARSEQMTPPHKGPDFNNVVPNYNDDPDDAFYIKTNQSLGVLDVSSNITIAKQEAISIVSLASNSKTGIGEIKYNKLNLKYIKVQKQYGFIIVFLDKAQENSVLNRLLFTFLIIGIISLGLMFIISLFLANNALIPIKVAWNKQKKFVADASHELKTPITVINTNLEIVMDNKEDTVNSQEKWLTNAQWEITRMTKLVDDLLLIASSDSEESSIFKAVFNMSYAVSQSILPFEPLARSKGIIIKTKIQPEVEYLGDEGRIKQLITILVDNAIKYTPSGGNITVKLILGESNIDISVIDTGEGIPKEHLDKVFERFYRVEKSRSRSFGGSGLGLSIAQCIAKEHSGNISVKSSFGEGSNFKITLPLKV